MCSEKECILQMKQQLEAILANAKKELAAAANARDLDAARVKFLGKKGELTALLKGMRDLSPEERPAVGQLVNDVRAAVEQGVNLIDTAPAYTARKNFRARPRSPPESRNP